MSIVSFVSRLIYESLLSQLLSLPPNSLSCDGIDDLVDALKSGLPAALKARGLGGAVIVVTAAEKLRETAEAANVMHGMLKLRELTG